MVYVLARHSGSQSRTGEPVSCAQDCFRTEQTLHHGSLTFEQTQGDGAEHPK